MSIIFITINYFLKSLLLLRMSSIIYFEAISVRFTEEWFRYTFASMDVSDSIEIYIDYDFEADNEYINPSWWYEFATQTVWIEIKEYRDSESAFKFISDLKEGYASIYYNEEGDYINAYPIENLDEEYEYEDFVNETVANLTKEPEVTFDDLPPLQQRMFADLLYRSDLEDGEIVEEGWTPFKQSFVC